MNIKKVLIIVFLTLVLGIIAVVGFFILVVMRDEPPHFFPLNNSQSQYTVVKSSQMAQGWVENTSTNAATLPEPRYYIEYRGDNVFLDEDNHNFFRVTVGKSLIDLEPFVGKDVTINKGKFISSSQQCIVDKCININASTIVLNIDQLEAAK